MTLFMFLSWKNKNLSDFLPVDQIFRRDSIVENVSKVKEQSQNYQEFMVPSALLQTLDSNQNPTQFSKGYLEHVQQLNRDSMECCQDFRRFHAMMLLNTAKIYPEEVVKYKNLNGL